MKDRASNGVNGTRVSRASRLLSVDTPWGPLSIDDASSPDHLAQDQILDAALRCFSAQGIAATSMAALAKQARISRAWLYRNFASRDAIVRALLIREAQRFTEMLLAADQPERSTEETVTEAFIYIIRQGRQHRLVPEVATQDTGPLARATVSALEGYLVDRRAIPPVHARVAAETIVRLIISILTTPATATDFDNDEELRSYAYRVIPPLVASE